MGDVSTTDSAEANATDEGTPKLRTVPLPALRVGMYVHLNCSWFLHPFAHQQFMLSSKEQVERIIALNLPVQVDPSRSDVPLDLDGTAGDEPAAGPSEPAVDSETAVAEPSAPVPATPTPKTPKPQSLDSYRSDLREAEQLCKEACADFQRAFQELGAGHDTGVAGAKTVINQLVPLVSDETLAGSLSGLMNSLQMDEADARHALNVSVLSMMVGQQLELSAEDIKVLGIGALLHDVGERKIPPEILARRGALTAEDQIIYAGHPDLGLDVLEEIPSFPTEALRIIQLHHERLDGSGYPQRVSGEYLSLLTKIVMVADVYDELVQPHHPKRSLTPSEALAHLFRHTQRTLPREIVVALIQTLSVYPPGTIVELVNGAYGLVLNVNRQERLKPLVLIYTPAESETDPLVVNLMTDPNRAIAQRASRQRLSSRVIKYLDLTRWLSYFLHGSSTSPDEATSK